jgi:hypothetical protein
MKKDRIGFDMQNFQWVVVKDKTVKIVIDQAEPILDYDVLKEYSPCILSKTLRRPLMIHDAVV